MDVRAPVFPPCCAFFFFICDFFGFHVCVCFFCFACFFFLAHFFVLVFDLQDATVNAGAGKSTLSQARRAKAGGVAADLDNPASATADLYR